MLTRLQVDCLLALGEFDRIAPPESAASDVSRKAGRPRFWAAPKLKRLEELGYCCKDKSTSPYQWRLTPAGRDLVDHYKAVRGDA